MPRTRGRYRDRGTRLDDADDRNGGIPEAQSIQRRSRGRVAGNDQTANAAGDERVRALERIPHDACGALRSVRQSRGVTQVDESLLRQCGAQGAQDGQPADPRIENADRAAGVDQNSGRMFGNNRTSRMDGESVNSITMRSTPNPRPAVGGIPYSSARI